MYIFVHVKTVAEILCHVVGAVWVLSSYLRNIIFQVINSTIAHANLADTWCSKANGILCTTPKLLDIEDMLKEAEQFLWAGHEMNTVSIELCKLNFC